MQIRITQKVTIKNDRSLNMYFSELTKFKTLSIDEEVDYFRRYQENQDTVAREKLIQHNLKFVVSVAKNYQSNAAKISIEDLVGYGNVGLCRAIEKFDVTKGFKFISYAVFWIQQSIREAIVRNHEALKYPQNYRTMINKVVDEQDKFLTTRERLPTNEELLEICDITPQELEAYQMSSKFLKLINLNEKSVSNHYDDSTLWEEMIADPNPSLLEIQEEQQQQQYFVKTLIGKSGLDQYEKDVIKSYFGVLESEEEDLLTIGLRLNRTSERMRQKRNNAIRKMKNSMLKKQEIFS